MVRSICSLRSHAVWCAFLFVIAFLSPALVGAAEDTEKAASLRSVSVQLIDVGAEQLRRGAYSAAQKSLEQANENRQYLSESERKNLDEMLKKTQAVSVERERIYEKMQTAAASAKSKDYSRAISALSFIQDSPYLTKVERTQVQIDLAAYKGELKSRQQEVAGLFAKSITLYNEGELDNARKGFEQVASSGVPLVSTGPTAKEYIAKIDEQKAQASAASPVVAETTPAVAEDELLNAKTTAPPVAEAKAPVAPAPAAEFTPEAQPAADAQTTGCVTTQATAQCAPVEGSYVDKVMQQRNVQRSYTEAVVDDALAKARSQTRQGDFAAARNSIYAAWRVVDNNKLLLGDDLYKKMNDALDSVKSEIDAGDAALTASERQQKQTDAVALQRQLRSQQDTERSQRIDDLMNKALALQREQRYEDARGQLELLLAIDPHNEHALTMHQTLTDMINFRKQLEVRKEIDEQTNETFLNSDKSTIPYADEIKYPRDWRDIVSKRDSAQGGGISEASTKVNRQLSETVDLSKLTPDTAFGDAVVMLQNSVQPMLQVVVRWPDLQENADITRLTRINMDPVSAISLRKALEELLSSVSGGGITLGYVIDESGVITIATKASLPSKLTQRAYDISDLLGIPADFFSDMTQTGLGQTQQAATAGGGGGGGGQRQQQQSQNQQQLSSQELRQQSQTRMSDVIAMIQTIQPESWQTTGPGSVTVWGNSLVVLQTAEIHQQIEEMIEKLRLSSGLGQQVAIEARFLLVSEKFLEDIGFDVDFTLTNLGGKWDPIQVNQNNLVDTGDTPAMQINGAYGGILDDLQVAFIIKATQQSSNSRSLQAPRVTVLSGESATFRVTTDASYVSNVTSDQSTSSNGSDNSNVATTTQTDISTVTSGVILNITPTISSDRKYVLLRILTSATSADITSDSTKYSYTPVGGSDGTGLVTITVPSVTTTEVQTRVSVPDKGTLLMGGQKITDETQQESGVPILGKLPIIGRLFSNRNEQREQKVLLILVTPTVILQEEREREAFPDLNAAKL